MTNTATGTVRGEDGTEIPVHWVYPGADECEWIWNRDHWPEPFTPMEAWFHRNGASGVDRAWREAALEPPPNFYRYQFAGPFGYTRRTPYPPARMADVVSRYRGVVQRYGSARGFWREYCQPRIEEACKDLAGSAADAPLDHVAEGWAHGRHQTFTSAAILGEAIQRLTNLLAESIGTSATLMAFEVTQGGKNASQTIDSEIWDLAALARQTPVVKRLLADARHREPLAALRREPTAVAFVAAFDAVVERHGSRSQGWQFSPQTWAERPEAPLALVRAQLESDGISPAELAVRSAARRQQATDEALSSLPQSEHEDFQRIVAELDGYVGIREDRAYWQMVIAGEARNLLLRQGARLQRLGRVDRADDILFLVPEDFDDGGTADLRGVVSERRAEWEGWRKVVPPLLIGIPGAAAAEATQDGELRGLSASRGRVTGRARILHNPEEGAWFRSGEVLVCVMTTPAWTPLFAIAGGVITETGGPLSHPAIAAREYAIPCVVAVKNATTRIRDGQVVTIDGAAGVVTLEG